MQAAQALGVSISTIKRWVDEGILPAHRTPGGHRKLLRAEVLALARQGALPLGDLGAATLPAKRKQVPHVDSLAATLLDALRRGDGTDASAVLRRAYSAGIAVETLADQVIGPVMAQIGRDWETERIDVWQEHRSTQVCAAALHDLKKSLVVRAERSRPLAVGGAPEGDPYLLPTLLAELVLLDAGWQVVQLGPNTPLPSLAKALRELRPRLLWLSVSYLVDSAAFIAAFRTLQLEAQQQGVPIAVGGQALAAEPIRSALLYTTYGDSLTHLATFARTLHPRPKLPRRGRPRQS